MRHLLRCTLFVSLYILISAEYLSIDSNVLKYQKCYPSNDGYSVYNYSIVALNDGKVIDLHSFKDKALLFVNVATYCHSAEQQYLELNALKNFFGGQHFEIIAVPCNQFGMLEPATKASDLLNGLKYVRPGNGFEPNFTITKRVDVNGPKQDPLYLFMKRSCPSPRVMFEKNICYERIHERDIRWNFEKILVTPHTGLPYRRYDFAVKPRDLVRDIQQILMSTKNVSPVWSEKRFQLIFGNFTEGNLKA